MIRGDDTEGPDNRTVRRVISLICDRYLCQFPNERDRLRELQTHLADPSIDLRLRRTTAPGHLFATGILLLPESNVLLVQHKSSGRWSASGGHYEVADTHPAVTAVRETEEDTGLWGVALHPWHFEHRIPLDIAIHQVPGDVTKGELAHQHFDLRYLLLPHDPEHLLMRLKLDAEKVSGFRIITIGQVDPALGLETALGKISTLTAETSGQPGRAPVHLPVRRAGMTRGWWRGVY